MRAHDGIGTAGPRRAAVRDREDAVVDRLKALGTALDGEPDPAFRAATRARLVAMAAVRSPEPARRPLLRRLFDARATDRATSAWRARLTAGLAGAAVAVTALATLVAVSTGARPGDALYGLKRGTEQTQLALAGDSRRGETLLGFARTRLEEVRDLVDSGAAAAPAAAPVGAASSTVLAAGPSPALVVDTLETMDRQTTEGTYWTTTEAMKGADAAALDGLVAWAADQTAGLRALLPDLPEGAATAAADSLALLGEVSSRGGGLSDALACASGPATAGADHLGPRPDGCRPPPPTSAAPGASSAPGGLPAGTGGVPSDTAGAPSTGGTVPGQGGGTTTGGLPTGAGPLPTPLPSTGPTGGGGLPIPSLPSLPTLPGTQLPSSGGGGTTTTTTPPPLIDTTLPICVPGLIC